MYSKPIILSYLAVLILPSLKCLSKPVNKHFVSKVLLPLPDTPVTQTNLSKGILILIFFRLFS